MKFVLKLLNNLYLPVIILILPIWFINNGLSAWLGGIYLVSGLIFGWFLLSVYLDLIKNDYLGVIFRSVIFQISFLLFSFWLVVSNESLLASGIVFGVNLFLTKELVFDFQKRRAILKKRLFNNIDIPDRTITVYLVSFIFLVALLAVFVIS